MPRVIGGTLAAHREHTTSKIFAALRALLYERGYDSLTLADIAEAAGMSRTAMYHYVPDKESLLVAYAVHETDAYLARLDEATNLLNGKNAAALAALESARALLSNLPE